MTKSRDLRRWLSTIVLAFYVGYAPVSALETQERKFDVRKMEAYSQDPEFNYSQDYTHSGSLVSIFLAYLLTKLAPIYDLLSVQSITPVFFKLLLIAGIVLVVLILLRLKYGAVLTKKTKRFENTAIAYAEGAKEDYEKLLQESLQNKEFKLAVRYLFLTALGVLDQQKNIKVTKWKAPYDYLKELPEEKRANFKLLTDLFENTWYGDYVPDDEAVSQGLQWYHQLGNA